MRRRWRWIGHVTRQEASIVKKPALHWTRQGKRRGGGSSEDHVAADGGERNATDGKDLEQLSVMTKDQWKWRDHVAALHATRRNGHE